MFSKTLLSTLLLVLVVAANPVPVQGPRVTLRLSRHINATSVHNILKHDQARARHLKNRAAPKRPESLGNEPIINVAAIYTASVGVGSPPTTYNLIVDTGSSNTWVGASKSYSKTSTSAQTGDTVTVSYGSGSFSGDEYTDTVTLGDLVVEEQSIGVASSSSGFQGFDGILGIGPVDLTQGSLSPHSSSTIPTVTDNAFSKGKINGNVVGVSFEPTTQASVQNGELTWGGVDEAKHTGYINYVPITSTYPASSYWGIDQSIKYGDQTILSSTAGIVDTGTTLILIASDAFQQYTAATGAVSDSATGLLTVTPSQYNNLKNLDFYINGVTYSLTPNAQIWPRSLNSAVGGSAGTIYLVVGDIGSSTGQGLDFINGYSFLERFYSVYDTTKHRVGLATTHYTDATSN